jgi:siroheme synthase
LASGDDLDYDHLARTPGTLVVFMGLSHLPAIVAGLLAAGKDTRTPAAVVSKGTRTDGRSVSGMLGELPELVDGLVSPALLVVGDVVAVGAELAAVAADARALLALGLRPLLA